MKGKEAYETCAICLEEFENADMIRVLPCSHSKSQNIIAITSLFTRLIIVWSKCNICSM